MRCRKLGVDVPCLLHVDAGTACIFMERLGGRTVKAALWAGVPEEGAAGPRRSVSACCVVI